MNEWRKEWIQGLLIFFVYMGQQGLTSMSQAVSSISLQSSQVPGGFQGLRHTFDTFANAVRARKVSSSSQFWNYLALFDAVLSETLPVPQANKR